MDQNQFAESGNSPPLSLPILTPEDRAEIRANACRIFRSRQLVGIIKPGYDKCFHGLPDRYCSQCLENPPPAKICIHYLPEPVCLRCKQVGRPDPKEQDYVHTDEGRCDCVECVDKRNKPTKILTPKPFKRMPVPYDSESDLVDDLIFISRRIASLGRNLPLLDCETSGEAIARGLPATPWATPWIPHSKIADVIDVSNGFNWFGHVGGTQPNDEDAGTGGESGQAVPRGDGFPTEGDIQRMVEQSEGYLTEEKIVAALADRNYRALFHRQQALAQPILNFGPVICKVTRVYEGKHAYEYNTPTTVELFEPEPNPCLLARIAKERRRLRYERENRLREDTTRSIDVLGIPRDLLREWNDKVGLPQDPVFVVVANKNRKAKPAPDAENNALVEMWIEDIEKPVDLEKTTRRLNVYIGSEDVRKDSETAWLYQLGLDPKTLNDAAWLYQLGLDPTTSNQLSETKKRQLRRFDEFLEAIAEGKCPTGTCPDNLCAKPNLLLAERHEIHALHLDAAKGMKIHNIGRWYCVVRLDRYRIKWLPDVPEFPAETFVERLWDAVQALIEKEMDAAEKQARRLGQDPEKARQDRKEAFSNVWLCQNPARLSQSPKAINLNKLKD